MKNLVLMKTWMIWEINHRRLHSVHRQQPTKDLCLPHHLRDLQVQRRTKILMCQQSLMTKASFLVNLKVFIAFVPNCLLVEHVCSKSDLVNAGTFVVAFA